MTLLLKENVNPGLRDKDNRTPLSYAAKKEYETIVKQLLEKKDSVDADSKNVDNWTPLSFAAEEGHEIVVKQLLEQNSVDPDSEDNITRRRCPTVEEGPKTVREVLQEPVDPNSKNNIGCRCRGRQRRGMRRRWSSSPSCAGVTWNRRITNMARCLYCRRQRMGM